MADNEKRTYFATRLGVIAATVGSAVGLGNIWRFPYEAGSHGGGAFLFMYIICVALIGIPVVCAEFVLGRHTGCNAAGAFRKLRAGKGWAVIGYMGILTSFLIMGFYSVVAGWTMEYIYASFSGFYGAASEQALHQQFDTFTQAQGRPLFWTLLFLAINFFVISRGVEKGIERISNILMPLLFVILLAFSVNALFLPGASEGLAFLFRPDFSALGTDALLAAVGQAFFSLSVGMGIMMTYGSYFSKQTSLVRTATVTSVLDTLVAVLAGIMIFTAVFSYGVEPAAGPRLVFEVLPSIFSNMPFGMVWSVMFFVLLFVASLTSTISLTEVSIAYLVGERGMSRRKATVVNGIMVAVMAALSSMSFGVLKDWTVFGMTFFELLDYVTAGIFLPIGGMLISVYAGWFLDRRILRTELSAGIDGRWRRVVIGLIIFSLKFLAPVAIFAIFLAGLLG